MHRELPSRRIVRDLTLLLLVGFVLRLITSQILVGGLNRAYEGDEGSYVNLATHIVQGLGFTDSSGRPTSYRAPGLPLLVSIPISFVGPNIIGLRIFMCFVESLLTPVFFFLVRSVTGSPKLALIAALIGIVFPTWLIPSGTVMTDLPAAIVVVSTAWMLIEGHRRQSLLWISGAGVCWGAATLIRAVSLVYAPAIILWLLVVMPDRNRRLAAVLAMIVAFGCLIAPWSIRNTHVHGKFVAFSTQAGIQLYISNNPAATGIMATDQAYVDATRAQRFPNVDEVDRDKLFQAEALNFIRENPWRFAQLCLFRFGEFWKLYSPRVPLLNSVAVIASFGLALPFFLLQAIRCGWRRGPEMLFVLIILCHMTVHMVYGSIVRYRVPIEPLIIVMAITGFCWVFGRIEYEYQDEPSTVPLNAKS